MTHINADNSVTTLTLKTITFFVSFCAILSVLVVAAFQLGRKDARTVDRPGPTPGMPTPSIDRPGDRVAYQRLVVDGVPYLVWTNELGGVAVLRVETSP